MFWNILPIVSLGVFNSVANELDPVFVARKWAPEVRLAVGENWRPSNIDFFLQNVNLKGGSAMPNLTPQNLPACNGNCYLETKARLDCNSCTNIPFLRGQDPSSVSAYAVYEVQNNDLKIRYLFFYPYNRGKRVCIGVYNRKSFWFVKAGCVGGYSTFGHHIGDWEDVTITLRKNGNKYDPVKIYVSAHDFGKDYVWNNGRFINGGSVVMMSQSTHPILYSADGSHGLWNYAGVHRYKNLPNNHFLEDVCSDGARWNTWEKLKVVRKGDYNGEFNIFNFQGRWGNRKSGCGVAEAVAGECMLNNGPTTP